MIGLGALGSRVAELLAQAGVSKFKLCDMDRLKPVNVTRHIGGISDFGASKVRVVQSRIQNINPSIRLSKEDIWVGSADQDLDRLSAFMADADLIISTTADESVESVINQMAVLIQKPVLYGRSLRRASMGRIFLVRPGRDPCKACLGDYARSGRSGKSVPIDWIDILEAENDVLLHECGRPVIAGSATDLSFISTLVSRIALNFLDGTSGVSNHWVWSSVPATDVDPRIATGFSTYTGTLPVWADCSVCREPPVVEMTFSAEIRQAIIAETESHPTVETGGILIGFINKKRQAIVTRVTGPGPSAIKSATRFHRDVKFVPRTTRQGHPRTRGKRDVFGRMALTS